jgi:hypothetical protein
MLIIACNGRFKRPFKADASGAAVNNLNYAAIVLTRFRFLYILNLK